MPSYLGMVPGEAHLTWGLSSFQVANKPFDVIGAAIQEDPWAFASCKLGAVTEETKNIPEN